MEVKKSKKASLEGTQSTNILMGIVVGLSFMFIAFEYAQRDIVIDEIDTSGDILVEEEIIEITRRFTPPPPPPPETVQADLIDIVEDNTLEEEVEFQSTEDEQKDAVIINYGEGDGEGEVYADDEIFAVVEEMPSFPGGDAALMSYISKSIKYPSIAQENGIQGRVICTFVINRDGKVTNAEVIRSVDPSLDKEALRVINNMPAWKPGKQRGKPVRVKYTLPIVFRLQ
ncbi:MAG: energy transducer TonB [Bacteroidales bacterium]|jgi:protein TonB|nr:energy transducer TonB [Bacteroidales bacterium]MDD3166546.1 energy transducer TonB [Bacteroidales bacterium]MDD4771021.1 energy transducer TonB [Bacteroidales bacterium]